MQDSRRPKTKNKYLAQKRLGAGLIQIMEMVKLYKRVDYHPSINREAGQSTFTRSNSKRGGDENGLTVERSGGSFTPVCTRPAGAPGFCGDLWTNVKREMKSVKFRDICRHISGVDGGSVFVFENLPAAFNRNLPNFKRTDFL